MIEETAMTKNHRKNNYGWPLSVPAVNVRLLRALLPLIVAAILIQGFLDETITRMIHINQAMFTLLLSLIFATITAVVIVQFSRIISRQIEKTEIERKRTDDTNLQLAAIIESSEDAIIGKTLDGIIISWNSGAEKMYGFTKEEAIYRPISIIIPADHQDEMKQILEKVRDDQHIDYYETVRQKKDGTQINVSVSISPVYNSDGILTGASTIARDVTKHKRVEETIKMNEVRLESLLKISQHHTESEKELLDYALNEAITLTGSKIGYIYFYDEIKQEFTLNTWSKDVMKECTVIEPQTIYQLEKTGLWGESVRQKKPIIVNDFHVPNSMKKGYPEGHAPLLKYLTIPVFSDNRIVAVVGVANKENDYTNSDVSQLTLLMETVWQISERKRAEGELRKLSRAVEQSPASIVITDPSGAIEYVNPKFVQLTGYSLEEAKGQNPRILKSGEKPSEEYKQLWDLITSGNEWRGEFHNKKKNGELYWEFAVISPIRDEQGTTTHYLAVKEDITERKRAEELVATQKRRLSDILEGTNAGTWEWNIQTGEKIYNERWTEIIGYTLEDLAPITIDTWERLVHPDDAQRANNLLQRHLNKETEFYECELRLHHKNGGWVWVLDRGKVVSWTQEGKPLLMSGTHQDITRRKLVEAEREKLIDELQAALAEVKTLSGLIPICASCKKVRDDNGYWQQVENYIQKHTEASFTHGLCPDCMGKYFPDYVRDDQKELEDE